jgi:demethylmenaquinone methyltransferase/2-methoxy-6-polyprenyl-1,4-benzoquinol methylase
MSTGRQRDSLISAAENRRMFADIVERYDLLNRLLSLGLDRRWRRLAVASVQPAAGGCYLDIGCGTGDMALELKRQAPAATVRGIDPVTGMLAVGRTKVAQAGLTTAIGFEVADACHLPYPEQSFDGITCAFCIRNVEDRAAVLAEMLRVLRPGARIAILELSEPRGLLMGLLNRAYSSLWVPLLGALLSRGQAYRYLIESIRSFPPAQTLLGEIAGAGFVQPSARPLTGGVVTLFSAAAGSLTGTGRSNAG